jgi:DnaJ family protein B protein 4
VLPGWKSGTKVRYKASGNEREDGTAQDVVFVVEEKPHDRFTREGDDLIAKLPISLVEALTNGGGTRTVEGLDGRKIQVPLPSGVVKPGAESRVPDHGMPIRKQGSLKKKGDLIVK